MVPVRNQIPSPATVKQGIVTILGSDGSAAHIRRTLSADMSSKNWVQQNGFFSPIKNSPSEGEEYFHQTPCDRDDVWRSTQSSCNRGAAKMESWDSILSQKRDPPPPAYVHPLVKRSSIGLSEKSLEICTESIGSESGSDCFQSSTKCSTVYEVLCRENRARRVVRYKSSPVRPLPPPLQSISAGGGDGGGSQLHMHSRRENGRLIVEAVSVAPENYFEARRGDGRLVLTLFRGGGEMATEKEEEEDKRVEEVFDNMEDVPGEEVADDGGGDEEGEEEFVVEKKLYLPSVCKKGLVMKTFVANAMRSNKAEEEGDEDEISIIQSLQPFPILARLIPTTPSATVTSFNVYEYFWRNKTTLSGDFVNPVVTASPPEAVKNKNSDNNNNATYQNRKLVIVKGNKGEHLVPYSTWGCMESRRSLIFLEPYCIPTS